MKQIHVIGGGTVFHVRPHMAISAIAYGNTARQIARDCKNIFNISEFKVITHLTKMASGVKSSLETNSDIKKLLEEICLDSDSAIIFLPAALCDFNGHIIENGVITNSGKDQPRLKSKKNYQMNLIGADKVISLVKKRRSDIILIGFKTTANVSENTTINLAVKLFNEADCDFVFANDIQHRINIIIAERGYISESFNNRKKALFQLVKLVANKYEMLKR